LFLHIIQPQSQRSAVGEGLIVDFDSYSCIRLQKAVDIRRTLGFQPRKTCW
jgi:hypothetical protein